MLAARARLGKQALAPISFDARSRFECREWDLAREGEAIDHVRYAVRTEYGRTVHELKMQVRSRSVARVAELAQHCPSFTRWPVRL